MKILVINSGSSSLKYKLINTIEENTIAKGTFEEIGSLNGIIKYENNLGYKLKSKSLIKSHIEAFALIKAFLLDRETGVLNNVKEISAIGHRIAHGGSKFKKPVIINDEVMKEIEKLISLAPLHNSISSNSIKTCMDVFDKCIPQIAVWDTSFYVNLPEKAYMYALPYEYFKKYKIRKYGFHGLSHYYTSNRCAKLLNKDIKNTKIISCHLGSGSSITAINGGNPVDTTMGLTPNDGLIMCTRSGRLDPGIINFMTNNLHIKENELDSILNKKSGLLGISGISSDFKEIQDAAKHGDQRALLAYNMFNYEIIKYIGSYIAILGGCDAITFTAGIGENESKPRKDICNAFSFMGVHINENLNKKAINGQEMEISTPDSTIKVYVIPVDEELVVAKEVKKLLS